jgi:hypothetical protein
MIKRTTTIIFLILLASVLSACSNTPDNATLRNTAVILTQEAIVQETIAAMPPTDTPIPPTATEPLPVYTFTPIVLPTRLRYETTATIGNATGISGGGLFNKGEVVSYSPATNSAVNPKQTFILNIVLKNTGTTIWNETYRVIHAGGTKMSYLDSYPVNAQVAQNGTFTLSMYITAPEVFDTYTQNWNLVDMNNAIVMSFSYNLIVGQNSQITSVPSMTATITSTSQPGQQSQLEFMCSDSARSIQQGQGCADFCRVYYPFKSPCYVLGTINPTITLTPTIPISTTEVMIEETTPEATP